jgi:diacylglycerol kinase family enzyme
MLVKSHSVGMTHALTPIRLPANANRVLLLANPTAGKGANRKRLDRLIDALRQHRLEPELIGNRDELAQRSAELMAARRLRVAVGVGGDGTAAELVNRTAPGTPITMLASGTENLLSKYLEMPREPEEVAEIIAAGSVVQHDAGCANGRLFVLMASFGFDAEVVRRLHEARRGHINHWSYLKPIWDTIRSYEYPAIRIYTEPMNRPVGGAESSRDLAGDRTTAALAEPVPRTPESSQLFDTLHARFAFVFNVPRYAMGFQFVPQAAADDGLLDVCAFEHGSFAHGLWYLSNVIVGRHPYIPDCWLRQTRRVRIESDAAVPYNLDGDPGGFTPVEIEIVPGRLTLLASPGWVGRRSEGDRIKEPHL